jgi:hypothetical protein
MTCLSIADVLRKMGEVPPSEMSLVDEAAPAPPVPSASPWIDANRIRASCARDVLERVDDDRSRVWRREMGARFAAHLLATIKPRTAAAKAQARAKRALDRDKVAEVEDRHVD